MTEPVLTGVQTHEIPTIWPFVEGMFEDAMEREGSDWTLGDVSYHLGTGEMQLWLATSPGRGIEAAMITRVQGRCSIFSVVGEDPDRWISLLGIVEKWARSIGCPGIRFEGRRGWVKKLPDYRVTGVIMEKDF